MDGGGIRNDLKSMLKNRASGKEEDEEQNKAGKDTIWKPLSCSKTQCRAGGGSFCNAGIFSGGGSAFRLAFRRYRIRKDGAVFAFNRRLSCQREGSDLSDSGNFPKPSKQNAGGGTFPRTGSGASFQDEPGRTGGEHGKVPVRRGEAFTGPSFSPLCAIFQFRTYHY